LLVGFLCVGVVLFTPRARSLSGTQFLRTAD
jgi:hypothetical protein